MKHKRLIFKIAGGILGTLLLFFLVMVRPDPFFNPNVVPKIVTANFIDLNRVYEISKYRSGAGHDYALNGETCRSMKHYFNHGMETDQVTHRPRRSLPTATEPNINIYAPFDGIIQSVSEERTPIGKQVLIVARQNPFYAAKIFHIDLVSGLHAGSFVKSGQRIATIGPKDGTDIAIEVNGLGFGGRGVSYFAAMTDEAFAPYSALGYKRSDFIISKAYRDAHPLECKHDQGEQFVYAAGYDSKQDLVTLRPNPYASLEMNGMGNQ